MNEQHLKYFAVAAATLFAGVGFAFKFLLDAKDYPELSLVMLATVAFAIGALALVGLCGFAAALAPEFEKSEEDEKPTRWSRKWFGRVALLFFATLSMAVLGAVVWVTFSFAAENLGNSMGILNDHLLQQIGEAQTVRSN